jgi:hypothetical protein
MALYNSRIPNKTQPPKPPSPKTALVPVTMLGAAAGAAVVFTVEEGDLTAVRKKLLPNMRRTATRAGAEMVTVVQEVKREADKAVKEHEKVIKRLQDEGRRLAPALEAAAVEAERALLPAVARGRREVERSLREMEGGGGREWGLDDGGRGRRDHHHQHGGGAERSIVRRFFGGGGDSE